MSTGKKHLPNFIKTLVFLFLTISSIACNKNVTGTPTDPGTGIDTGNIRSILFVGNSLTYANDLPALVEKIGKEKRVVLKTKTIAFPNYALEDHWNDGNLQLLIASKKYDFVVV